MYSEVLSKIESITKEGYLEIHQSMREHSYRHNDGYYRYPHGPQPFFQLYNGVEIYDNTDINFVKTLVMEIQGIDSDIKLVLQYGDDSGEIIHPTKRDLVKGNAIYQFEIEKIPLSILVSCENDKRYKLIKIKISGNKVSDILSLIDSTHKLYLEAEAQEKHIVRELSEEVLALKEQKKTLDLEISGLIETNNRLHETTNVEENQLKQTRSHVESSRSELKEVNEELERNRELSKDIIKRLKEDERKIEKQTKLIEEKELAIDEIERKLLVFKKDESLFSEDFSSFKEEIRRQNKAYYCLLIIFIGLISIVSLNIYNNAVATVDNYQFNFDLWTLLVSRLPLIFINMFILGAFSSVIYLIINLLTSNFNNIAKTQQVTYLVKDCVEAQSLDLTSLKEEQILKQRVESKMALIQKLIESSYEKNSPKIEESTIKSMITDIIKKQEKSKSS
ncbi:hypothetical protein L7E62_003410 [Vibrio parahaemolyticus]|uniref:hypothetical protein n=2 Tax=Vibrio parahaemolyticus TaxID=670 RepID=UPI0011244B0F|nr:hypothetical protein [Vibrio parahaemolyticus]EGQ7650901.1 hypothetical protein [Vibrio parahaemolyticus]EIV1736845.1 hypothetical protein [Vibrio parahaemolyticus]EJG1824783.1 hypothetical protein [Vibrio parahaemolyticus]ELC9528591.1 hypothetical protein [Vibrio parahaemolyticus]TOA46626.1 hypothetical protein CGK25_18385 [Vibrio parahaemolyticus]